VTSIYRVPLLLEDQKVKVKVIESESESGLCHVLGGLRA